MLRALTYEWRRLWSVRATWIMAGLFVGTSALIGIAPLFLVKEQFTQSWLGLYNAPLNFMSIVPLTVVASQAFGHEYRYGLIRLTLTEYPWRERVFLAKAIIVVAYTLIVLFVAWAALGLGGRFAPEGIMSKTDPGFSIQTSVPGPLWKVALYLIAMALFAMSMSLIFRNLAMGVVIPLILSTVVEGIFQVINGMSQGKVDWIVDHLLFHNANDWVGSGQLAHSGLIFALWVAVAVTISAGLFFKRDA